MVSRSSPKPRSRLSKTICRSDDPAGRLRRPVLVGFTSSFQRCQRRRLGDCGLTVLSSIFITLVIGLVFFPIAATEKRSLVVLFCSILLAVVVMITSRLLRHFSAPLRWFSSTHAAIVACNTLGVNIAVNIPPCQTAPQIPYQCSSAISSRSAGSRQPASTAAYRGRVS